MRKSTFAKSCLLAIALLLTGVASRATIFTAVVSGNFNSSLTWGGVLPGSLLSSDLIVIPTGITVTLTSTETFSGTSSLTVNGTLTSTTGSALILTSGSLAGTGTITVDSVALGLSSGFTFTGSLTAGALASMGASIGSSASITVSHSLDLTSGTLSLSAGSLTLGSGSSITLSGGTLSVSGSGMLHLDSMYSVTYTGTSATAGAELSGTGLSSLTVNVPGSVTLSANTSLNGTLTLTSGSLDLSGHTLTFGTSGNLSASGSGMLTGSASSNIVVNATGGLTGGLRFGAGGTLGNLTISTSAMDSVTLGSDLTITGSLMLGTGMLSLNGHSLTLTTTADLLPGSGTITGSASSDMFINTAAGLSGMLRMTASSDMLHSLTINLGSSTASVNLGSNLGLSGTLYLTSGRVTLGANNLSIAATGSLSGGSANSFVVTDSTGKLVMNIGAGAAGTFQVGTTTNFAPIVVSATATSAPGDVSVNVHDGVYALGTTGTVLTLTQPLVNATWDVSSTATTGASYTLTAMWSAGMEVNAFDRTNAYLSHFTGGAWDTHASAAATTSGSLYAMSRSGITSFSPFMVAGSSAVTTTGTQIPGSASATVVYPNPVSGMLYFSTPAERYEIFNVKGEKVKSANSTANSVSVKELPAGLYYIRLSGKDLNSVNKFVVE